MRYFGGRNLPGEATAWRDSVFGLPLGFYLFDLPFYALLRRFVLLGKGRVVYRLTARGWQLRDRIAELQARPTEYQHSWPGGFLKSGFLRGVVAYFCWRSRSAFSWAVRDGLERPQLHGWSGLRGPEDYLPLQWLVISACITAAMFVTVGRWKLAAWMALALAIRVAGLGSGQSGLCAAQRDIVERPYIQKHIEATRSAFGLDRRVRDRVAAKLDGRFDPAQNRRYSRTSLGLARLPRHGHANSGAATLLLIR